MVFDQLVPYQPQSDVQVIDEINNSFVGMYHDAGGGWGLKTPGKVSRSSELYDRFIDVTQVVLEACEGFIRPTELEYSLRKYSADGPIESIGPTDNSYKSNLISNERHTMADDCGVSIEDLTSNLDECQKEDICVIGDIESTRENVYITLRDYEGWINRGHRERIKPAKYNQIYEGEAYHDPIGFHIRHYTTSSKSTPRRSQFALHVNTSTDIWFKETPVGRANRTRLVEFFEELYEELEIVDAVVTSEGKNQTLRELLPNE